MAQPPSQPTPMQLLTALVAKIDDLEAELRSRKPPGTSLRALRLSGLHAGRSSDFADLVADPHAVVRAQQLVQGWLRTKSKEARSLASSTLEQYGAELAMRHIAALPITLRKLVYWLVAFVCRRGRSR